MDAPQIAWMAVQCVSSSNYTAQCAGRIALEQLKLEEDRHREQLEIIGRELDREGFAYLKPAD